MDYEKYSKEYNIPIKDVKNLWRKSEMEALILGKSESDADYYYYVLFLFKKFLKSRV